MFKDLPTGTKLFILCGMFLISIAVPIYGLVTEKQGVIDFSRKELVGNRHLKSLRQIYAAMLVVRPEAGKIGGDASQEEIF